MSIATGLLDQGSMPLFAKRNKAGIPKDKVKKYIEKYETILKLAEDEYTQHPPDRNYMDGFNLQKRLRDFQANHLYLPYIVHSFFNSFSTK